MNEFLKLKWRTDDLEQLEPQKEFIKEDVAAESLIFKFLEHKNCFKKKKKLKRIFSAEPYIPGLSTYKPTVRPSCLDTWQHEHCLTAMKLLGSGKDPAAYTTQEKYSIGIYNQLKPKIVDENAKYQEYARKGYGFNENNLNMMRAQIYIFGKSRLEENIERVKSYPQFFKEIKCFNMTHSEDDGQVDFKHILNPLELGTVARFTPPNLKSKCVLLCTTLPLMKKEIVYNSKLTVSQDANISKILESQNIDIVISLSSLKCLTDNTDLKQKWFIPVIVKEIDVKQENGGSVKKKVVFIDKPFPPTSIHKVDIAYKAFKRLVRTNFCQYEGVVYPDQDTIVEDTESEQNEKKHMYNLKRTHNTIHHNASYRIWNVKKSDDHNNLMKNRCKHSEMNVLVRSKLDGCETAPDGHTLQPVVVHPKVEQQLLLGANIASRSELAREWTSVFFAPFSNLYRVRMKGETQEVVVIEKCTLQKIVTEAHVHHEFKPHLGLGVLQKVFEELKGLELEPGEYLLQHLKKHEAFVAVMKRCVQSDKDSFDLHNEYENVVETTTGKEFLPIDVNFILPTFNNEKRLPGMFSPAPRKDYKQLKLQNKMAKKKKLKQNKKCQKRDAATTKTEVPPKVQKVSETNSNSGRSLVVYDEF